MEKTYDMLVEKSTEAFLMAIEIYNKPTIKYRVEGFSLFICNAWELMIKAHMLKKLGSDSIYYPEDKSRTITLEKAIKKIFTNVHDPLRQNLEKIIELRNTSTHFVTEEYEMIYVSLFQACVLNYSEKMMNFHGIDISTIVPQNFLTLTISMEYLNQNKIIAKYPEEIANKIISLDEHLIEESEKNNNASFAIRIDHHHFITKDVNKATSFVKIDKDADTPVRIVKDIKDPSETHKYNAKKTFELINQTLKKKKIPIELNNYTFLLFVNYFGLKSKPQYTYVYRVPANPTYSYSMMTVDFIVKEIEKDPENIIQDLKERIKKNKS
ncbi:DUF3644 domain-containing protein [Listeria monocytogenes]|nr:DUF3644 domain-containing protein [Listeria monocytogenes]EJM6842174.1 DUF3644 domain-containing protein [Listeria monocytogenes]